MTYGTSNNADEIKKFESTMRSIVRTIRQIQTGTDEDKSLRTKAIRAIDRAYDLARFLNCPQDGFAQIEGLSAARRFACEQAAQNLRNERYAEMDRLEEIIREKRFDARLQRGW